MSDWNTSVGHFSAAAKAYVSSAATIKTSQKDIADSQREINRLTEQGKTDSEQYTAAVDHNADAWLRHHNAVIQNQEAAVVLSKSIAEQKVEIQTLTEAGLHNWTHGYQEVGKAQLQQAQVMGQALKLEEVNLARLKAGLGTVTLPFLQSINKIRAIAGKGVALKLETTGSPQAVQAIAILAEKAKNLGATKAVVRILSDTGTAEQKFEALKALLKTLPPAGKEAGSGTGSGFLSGLNKWQGPARSAGQNLGNAAKQGAQRGGTGANTVGQNIGQGFISGLASMIGSAISAAVSFIDRMISAAKGAAHSHSPSRLTYAIGQNIGDGFVLGLRSRISDVTSAAADVARAATLSGSGSLAVAIGRGASLGAAVGDSGGGGDNIFNIEVPGGDSPDVGTMLALVDSKVKARGGFG